MRRVPWLEVLLFFVVATKYLHHLLLQARVATDALDAFDDELFHLACRN